MLTLETQYDHNYDNEKVAKWVVENLDKSWFDSCWNTQGFCDCHVYPKYENGRESFFYEDENGNEHQYHDYIAKFSFEYLIEAIPDLTAEEKEELEDMEELWIYYCPECKQWALDGANI